jgi:hypothetical protein
MGAALLRSLAFAALVSAAGITTGVARADDAIPASPSMAPSLEPLLSRLARHAEQFEQMKRRGSFTVSGRMEELDRSGHPEKTKEMTVRVTATPAERLTEIVRYTEDGADKTAEARRMSAERKAKSKKKPSKTDDFHLPFLASEQPRYVFSLAERDPGRARSRVVFQPVAPAEDTLKGSAWVDENTGEVLTLAFTPSKKPAFVDHVEVTVRFDLVTPLGRAPSTIAFDARGGFLIVRKHYRGTATISDARLGF